MVNRRTRWGLALVVGLAGGGVLAGAGWGQQKAAGSGNVPGEPAGFKGWVCITMADAAPADPEQVAGVEVNLQSGEMIRRSIANGAGGGKLAVTYENPVTGERWEYDPVKEVIERREISPMERADILTMKGVPVSYAGLLADLHITMGDVVPTVTHGTDRGMDRCDFEYPYYTHPFLQQGMATQYGSATPRTVWLDAGTHLIREVASADARGRERHAFVSYSDRGVHSIFDAGAPKSAKVEDMRMKAEWAAVFDRVEARAGRPFPDGLMVRVETDFNPGNGKVSSRRLMLYTRAGSDWAVREYDAMDAATEGPSTVDQMQIPDDWRGTGNGEFFRRLANVYPSDEEGGDGKTAWGNGYNAQTGQKEHQEQVGGEMRVLGGQGGAAGRAILSTPQTVMLPGVEHIEGFEVQRTETTEGSPLWDIYPHDVLETRYSAAEIVSVITDPARAGQIGLRIDREPAGAGRGKGLTSENWIDPAHEDRPVASIVFTKGHGTGDPEPDPLQTTQFGGYQQFPAPDGRSYPTNWTVTTHHRGADGKVTDMTISKAVQVYFAGRGMPPVPATPTTLPAHREAIPTLPAPAGMP